MTDANAKTDSVILGQTATAGPAAGPDFLPVPDIAAILQIPVTRVHQLIRDRAVLAIRRGGFWCIPAEFVEPSGVVKGLPATITLLSDAGFADAEILDWIFAADPSLPGRPIDALRENRGREVHRRAQAAGF